MDDLSPSDLKTILHSKRANIYYLEHCRVMQKDGRVLFLVAQDKKNQYWNIPIANTTVILLGVGTSITQAAVRMLSQAGVVIGFCGTGGTPLHAGVEIEWMTPQSEYRPTEYVQGWTRFWFEDAARHKAAIAFQKQRVTYIRNVWDKDTELKSAGFSPQVDWIAASLNEFETAIEKSRDSKELLLLEARLTKQLYKYAAQRTGLDGFLRDSDAGDKANDFLNHGNYLAYGLAASTLWVLGIPHGFAVMHGKTRRGALVFDVADLIKDAVVLPWAFICAQENLTDKGFRTQCLLAFARHKSMDFMFNQVKNIALNGPGVIAP